MTISRPHLPGKATAVTEAQSTPIIEVLESATKPKGWAKEKKARQRKSMKDKIEDAIQRSEHNAQRIVGEGIIKSTGQRCFDMPWVAASPRPWRDGYTRVMIPLAEPTKHGHKFLIQIVRNSNLSHGQHS